MHKMRLNRLELGFTIKPNGPILVKSGVAGGMGGQGPNMEFVTTEHPKGGGRTVFLPGSSLKGVLRSHAERIARTWGVDCCDPLDHDEPCNQDMQALPGPVVYQNLCPVCRLFGSTNMASHFVIQDAYPSRAVREETLPIRDMVAINRQSGAVQNPFKLRVATETSFRGSIVLENFERWQLGLLALVLRDLATGLIRIGHGKTRGLGRVSVGYRYLCLSYPLLFKQTSFGTHVYGVAELATEPELIGQNLVDQYGWQPRSFSADSGFEAELIPDEWGMVDAVVQKHEPVEDALRSQVSAWQAYAQTTGEVPHGGE